MAISSPDFQFLQKLVVSRAGVVLTEKEKYLSEARLLPLARLRRLGTVSELLRKVQSETSDESHFPVIDALLPKETSFFRDIYPFELLRNQIFKLLEMKRSKDQRLIIWCAGCSSGQEAYSIAMILHRYFSQLLHWHLEIYSTDLSSEALKKAKEGRYDEVEIQRGISPVLAKEYFRQAGPNFFVKEDLSKLVQFEEFNLAGEWPELTKVDVVFLRNVLRYMSPAVKREILGKLKEVLQPDGYLFMGAEESASDIDGSFSLVPSEQTVYFQLSRAPAGS
jgi:chemotaxis protein methyltransferase CheR